MEFKMSGSRPIAIIGAGLSGLCLALSLHRQKIPCVIYEARTEPLDIGGAIMLSPNALRILDALCVYERLEPLVYHFDHLYFQKEDGQLLDTFEFGSVDKYGYSGVRVYRFELMEVLLEMLSEAGIKPFYGKKFTRVISEDENSITWAFEDGSTDSASLLLGADGIHSRVRPHVNSATASIHPSFTQMIGVTAAVPKEQLGATDGFALPVTFMNKKHGAFIAAPQGKDGTEVLIGKQRHFIEELDRQGWNRIINDKEWCVEFLRTGLEDYPPLVARAVSHISIDKIHLWPFYVISKLESWISDSGRVVILGDAAHAIPPTAGQGVNQAFEDVYAFARVLDRVRRDPDLNAQLVLQKWQQKRQERVDGVLELNSNINKRRMPSQPGEGSLTESFDLRRLYDVDFNEMVDEIVTNT